MLQVLLNLGTADYIIIAILFVSVLISLIRGFFKELLSLVIWVIGFWVAIKFYGRVAEFLETYITNAGFRQVVSFSSIFILILIFGAIFNYLFTFILIKTGLSSTDRLLGMIFGCARGILLVAVILLLISSTAFTEDSWWKESVLIPHFKVAVDWLEAFLPQKMTDIARFAVSK